MFFRKLATKSPTKSTTRFPTRQPKPDPTTYIDCNNLLKLSTSSGTNSHVYGAVGGPRSWFEVRDAVRDLDKCCGKSAHLV
jgi:hypothetical protein